MVVLGATGSIGENAFRVLEKFPERFDVVGLVARNNIARLAQQARVLHCRQVVTTDPAKRESLQNLLPHGYYAFGGESAVIDLVCSSEVDVVLCAIVGTGGVQPVLAALQAGKTVALASKEVLVMAGELVMNLIYSGHGRIIPVDSEHSAIFQCLSGRSPGELEHIMLTASGGAFRDAGIEEMRRATPERALAHPTWSMGPKVTIDSASLMNKALEIVEAGYLFGVGPEKIRVVIHPQSIVHSMIELKDGSILAQLAQTDMRFAIQYALSYPERLNGELPRLQLKDLCRLEFREPDRRRFPSIGFAEEALRRGGTMPAVMNAANEVAVAAFCQGRLRFTDIWTVIERTMRAHRVEAQRDLATVLAADRWAREFAGAVEL